jgi:hypothetical protein
MTDIYFMEEMDSHLFTVVRNTGEVLEKVDILSAEGLEHRLSRCGMEVEWVDRGALKERKHVRNLISQYRSGCVCTGGCVSLQHR